MSRKILMRAIEQSGQLALPYSGRGSFGREWISFTVAPDENMLGIVAQMVAYAREEDQEALVEAFENAKTDSLGRSTVVYFPSYAWEQREAS